MTFLEGDYSLISSFLGNASMLFWIFAQIPQLVKNFRSGSVKSLSKTFLLVWLLGDFLNLVGSILTYQQPFQIRLATYFVTIDMIMIFQFYVLSESSASIPLLRSGSSLVLFLPSVASSSIEASVVSSSIERSVSYKIGLFLSWICAFLYLSSRIPQIILNYKRKSCDGLSLTMFMFAFMGNFTYAASLLISQIDIWGSMPFLVGSLGTLCQDLFILYQSWIYDDQDGIVSFEDLDA
jgi:uncharacterized protein with PQ loop repeat